MEISVPIFKETGLFSSGRSIWRLAISLVCLISQGCFQDHNPGTYSLYHVRTYNQLSEPTESYIKRNANIVLHISSLKLDREFEELEALAAERKPTGEFEAHTLLVRHTDNARYRLGISIDCDYLVIFHDSKIACDQNLFTAIFKQFVSPITEIK